MLGVMSLANEDTESICFARTRCDGVVRHTHEFSGSPRSRISQFVTLNLVIQVAERRR